MEDKLRACPFCNQEPFRGPSFTVCRGCDFFRSNDKWQEVYAWKLIDELTALLAKKDEALLKVRTYLEERGIRSRGTIGRTIVLPMLDEALSPEPKGDL